jgi:GH43 family beta-xylosidase
VGHCCFTQSPDGTEDWIVYHSKTRRWDGWHDRVVRAQPFGWRADGLPDFGRPIYGPMPLPSGEAQAAAPALSLAALPAA